MTLVLNFLLTNILVYGYPIIVFMIIGSEMGLPLPTGTLLIAAGSFSSNGSLNFYVLVLIAALTSIIGDLIGYYIGKRIGKTKVDKILSKFKIDKIEANSFIVFITRWLPLPLTVPVNLISGYTEFSIKKFSICVIIGEFLWAFGYIYLGYFFGANWSTLVEFISGAPFAISFGIIGVVILYYTIPKRS